MHHLRHGYATSLAEEGVNERAAQYLLGHADSRTTREIYTHTTDRMMGLAAELINEAFQDNFGEDLRSRGSQIGSHHDVEDVKEVYGDGESGR